MKNNITEISGFMDRYKDFSKRLERQKIIHYKTKFDGLLRGYDSLKNIIETFDIKEALNFNIFDILNINTAEVKTHTPFLKNLLDPNGTHGQVDLFLKSFIQKFIPIEKRDFFVLKDRHNYNVVEEKHMMNGRIDIYIHSIDPKKKFGLVIENKLYAGDQYLQIERYYEFLKGREFNNEQMIMFYLTIDGRDPTEESIDKNLLKKLNDNNVLFNISYKTDIKNWLTDIYPKVQASKVHNLISQYLYIIENLK